MTRSGHGLLPPRWTSRLRLLALSCLGLAAALAAYTRGRRTTPPDLWVDRALAPLRSGPASDLDVVVQLVEPPRMLALCVLLALLAVALRSWAAAALCSAGAGLAFAATAVAKQVVSRPSATLSDEFDAYPSGHAAGVFTVLALVLVLSSEGGPLRQHLSRPAVRSLRLGATACAATASVALTALRHHYVTDVVGGAALTVGAVVSVALLVDLSRARADRFLRAVASAGRVPLPSCSPAPPPDRRPPGRRAAPRRRPLGPAP